MTNRVVIAAAKIIKSFCDENSCDDCPFVYYTNDDALGQWCKLVDEQIAPKDWRLLDVEPEEVCSGNKEARGKKEEISD